MVLITIYCVNNNHA